MPKRRRSQVKQRPTNVGSPSKVKRSSDDSSVNNNNNDDNGIIIESSLWYDIQHFTQLEQMAGPIVQDIMDFNRLIRVSEKDDLIQKQIFQKANKLLAFLDSNNTNDVHKFVPKQDVANIMIPWATKLLVQTKSPNSKDDSTVLWSAVASSLQVVFHDASSSVNLATTLTQKILNRLVPESAKFALDKDEDCQTAAATTYTYLLHHMYHPTFEYACQTLLPIFQDSFDVHTQEVIFSTLQLLQKRQPKGNVKKNFVLLSSPNILVTMSSIIQIAGKHNLHHIDSIARDILFNGLFNAEHADAFRSIKAITSLEVKVAKKPTKGHKNGSDAMDVDTPGKKTKSKTFRCYQESLLETLHTVQTDDDKHMIIKMCDSVPLLIEGFIEWTAKHEDAKKVKGPKRKRASELARFQFGFFACLTRSLLNVFDSKGAVDDAVFSAIHKSLLLVLKHDVYLPSTTDKDLLEYLQSIATVMLRHGGTGASFLALDALNRLNHLLLHESLVDIFRMMVSSSINMGTIPREAKTLLSTIIVTYQQLRQVDHLYSGIFHCVLGYEKNEAVNEMHHLEQIVSDPQFETEVSQAVQRCPGSQVLDIFCKTDEWLRNINDATTSNKLTAAAIRIGVHLLCLVLQHLKVEQRNALDLDRQCRLSMEGTVLQFVCSDDSSGRPSLAKNGLQLAGSLVDLQVRCAFWAESTRSDTESHQLKMQSAIPPKILEILDSKASSDNVDEDSEVLDELVKLAVQRTKQLHSLIYEQQRAEFATASTIRDSETSIAEAQKFTNYALRSARHAKSGQSKCWKVLAQSVGSWSAYAKPSQIDEFLIWFWSSFSSHPEATKFDFARSLMKDASFYENIQVSGRIGANCLQVVKDLIQIALGDATSSNTVLFPPEGTSERADQAQLMALASNDSEGDYQDIPNAELINEDTAKKALLKAEVALLALNEMPVLVWQNSDYSTCFELVLRIDSLLRFIVAASSSVSKELCKLHSIIRDTLSSVLHSCPPDWEKEMEGHVDQEVMAEILQSTIQSTLTTFCRPIPSSHTDKESYVNSSERLVGAIVQKMQATGTDSHESMRNILDNFAKLDGRSIAPYSAMLRSIVLATRNKVNRGKGDPQELVDILNTIHEHVWTDATRIVFQKKDAASYEWRQCTLLISEVLRSCASIEGQVKWLTGDLKDTAIMTSIRCAEMLADDDVTDLQEQTCLYFLSCAALIQPSSSQRQEIVNCILCSVRTTHPLAEASFNIVIQMMEPDELTAVLNTLAVPKGGVSKAALRLKLFALMLLDTKMPADVLATTAHTMFFQALDLLSSPAGSSEKGTHNLNVATTVIIELSKRKDVVSLRERDIGLVFAQTTRILGYDLSSEHKSFVPVSSDVYRQCFSLTSSFLQRFSKQIYVCVPLAIKVLLGMLRHALFGHLDDLDMVDRGQKFTRLCELLSPHKDVYKKHILGLILEFVHALVEDLSSTRKASLTPAIYCLLDMLSEYETRQLNVLMGTTAKALFRTVHQNYQKSHVYKGQ